MLLQELCAQQVMLESVFVGTSAYFASLAIDAIEMHCGDDANKQPNLIAVRGS
ncbi:hypothetical protein D3C71_1853320 [compost metagenome]